ncbi:MAG: hypothetical protein V7K72_08330 [Nostoc sp.]|uniref:hypothetical protein n=1 Tax=Nostoc sp. TaxID=1180 RepID=UPI002FF8AE14
MLHRSLNYIAERSLFISRKDAKEEESDRTLEILQAIALFNEPQRRREHRGRRERSHAQILQAIAFPKRTTN